MKEKSTFSYDAPKDSPGYLLWKTTTSWQRLIKKALEPFDISHAQFVILAVVKWFDENKQDVTQINIVNLSGLDKMTVSKSLKKLSSLKLITRAEYEHDTRAKVVALTTPGHKLIGKLVPIIEGIDCKFFSKLSTADQTSLIKIFNRLSL